MATELSRLRPLQSSSLVPHLSAPQQIPRIHHQGCAYLQARHTASPACTSYASAIAPLPILACQQYHSLRRRETATAAAVAGSAYQEEPVPPWRKVVAVTAGCLLLCSLHRNTFSVLLPDLCTQLGLRSSQAGAVQAAMLTAYLAGQVPGGILADRYGGTRVLLWGLVIWSSATALTAAAGYGVTRGPSSTVWPLAIILVSRVVMGLASACVMPCVTATAVRWVPKDQKTSMISFVYANFHIGGVIGLTMVPLVADALGGEAAFLVSGSLGIIWAVCGAVTMSQVHKTIKPTRLNTAVTTNAAQASQQSALPALQQHHAQLDNLGGSRVPQQQQQQRQQQGFIWQLDAGSWRQIALMCYAHAVIGLGFFIMQNFIPLLLASLGSDSLAMTGRLSSMPWLAAAVVGMMAGSAADSLVRNGLPTLFVRRLMQGLSFLGCGLSVLPLALNPNIGLMPAVYCLTANLVCYSLSYGGFQSYLQETAGKHAGIVQGLTNSASIVMGIFGSLLTGWVVEVSGTYSAVFWLLGFVYVSAAAVWCLCTSTHKLQTAGNPSDSARP